MRNHQWYLSLDNSSFVFLLGLIIVLPISSALSEIAAFGLIVCWITRQFFDRFPADWKRMPLAPTGFLVAFMIWSALVSLLSQYPLLSFRGCITKWGEWIFVAWACCSILTTPGRIRIFFKVLLVSSFFIVFDGFWQILFGIDFLRGNMLLHGIYPTAAFSYYTSYACYVMVLFLIGVGIRLKRKLGLYENIVLAVHHGIFLLALVLTFSRAAWLAALLGLAGLALLREKRLWIFLLLGILVFILLSPFGLAFRFREFFYSSWGGYRPEIWRATLEMIGDSWMGVGINNYSRVIGSYYASGGYAHNSFLQLAAETGIPGIFLFLGWLFSLFFWALKKLRSEFSDLGAAGLGILVGIIGFSVCAFFDNHFFNAQMGMFFWLLLGGLMAMVIPLASSNTPSTR